MSQLLIYRHGYLGVLCLQLHQLSVPVNLAARHLLINNCPTSNCRSELVALWPISELRRELRFIVNESQDLLMVGLAQSAAAGCT